MNTIVEKNMPHHHQSHASCNKLLPPGPPVLNIFSSEEDTPALPVLNSFSLEEDTPVVLKDVDRNMPHHHHQSHGSRNKLLPPGPPVLNIFSFEEDTPALPVFNNFSREEDTPAVLKDEYKILGKIGRGAFGVVHEAIHIKVCLQVLSFVSSKYYINTHIQLTTTRKKKTLIQL